jgi:hypothetical protein
MRNCQVSLDLANRMSKEALFGPSTANRSSTDVRRKRRLRSRTLDWNEKPKTTRCKMHSCAYGKWAETQWWIWERHHHPYADDLR